MPDTCLLMILDGLGDRGHDALDGQTPLQAATTPTFDALAAAGCNGLYHPGLVGRAMPSELAHFLLFGYPEQDFPGRGALEALGAGIPLGPQDVAVMARFVHVEEQGGALRLLEDTPKDVSDQELAALAAALPEMEILGLHLRHEHIQGLHGLLLLRPAGQIPSPLVTDTNPIRDGAMLIEPRPLAEAGSDPAPRHTAAVLKEYLVHCHRLLAEHPVNLRRRERGLSPLNALATQRAGRLRPVRGFTERYGLGAACLASGNLFRGLALHLGMEFIEAEDDPDPTRELAQKLELARDALQRYDFIHLHTKAPDKAAHTKNCRRKRDVISALDRGASELLPALAQDPGLLLAVTADHSTPSCGALIHSGEPVPLLLHGQGVRRDTVAAFDEISAAAGGLGLLRGAELMLMLLNHLDRARLAGLRDCPETFEDAPAWPGTYEPFSLT